MSLIRVSRSLPEAWMVFANSTWRAVRFPSAFSVSWWARMSRLLSGVRSSWDMLARNSDLYLEVRASWAAFSSSACRACSTSRFFRSTSAFWSASRRAFSSSSSLVCCSSSCWLCSSRARDCDCRSRSSVRELASIVLGTIPIAPERGGGRRSRLVGGAGDEPEARRHRALAARHRAEDGVRGRHDRRQLGEDHPAHGEQVALALQHPGELGEVGLQPVLLRVLLGGLLEVADHLVDVVLQLLDLALRHDVDGAGEVALGHGGSDLRDGPHLGGEVGRELVHVVGEVLPRARRAGNEGLAAELALDAQLAGHGRDLLGQGREG